MGRASICIAGGGTGGHLYPGLAVADELRRQRPDLPVFFVGTTAGIEARVVPENGYPLHFIRAGGIAGKSWPVRIGNALRIPLGMAGGARIMRQERASVVMGVGGYASGPVVLAGKLTGRGTLILEQNATPGATNRILAPLVNRVAVAFAATAERLPGKVVVTGNPMRASLETVTDSRRADVFSLMVVGGSRGARGLNQVVMEALPQLAAAGKPLAVLHQTGPADHRRVRAAYDAAGIEAQVVPYIDDMAGSYAGADLLLCRAGATTVAELAAAGRAAVLVPFPHATGAHQEENAKEMVKAGAALLMRESQAGNGALATLVLELLHDAERRGRMEAAARSLRTPDAAGRVAGLVLELYDRASRRLAAGNGRPS